MANFVQNFRSTDIGAPVLTGQVNSGVALFLACLVNGYATLANSALTEVGSLVTVTLAVANATLRTGDYVKIAGVTPGGYNGTWQITVLSGTQFTFTCTSTGLGAASVVGTYNKAGLGWTQPATGTNAAQFKMGNSGGFFGGVGSGHVIEVQDNGAFAGGAKEMGVRGAESSGGMGSFTGPYPTAVQWVNGLCMPKSSTADATARAWTLIGDDKGFYFWPNCSATTGSTNPYYFGWFPSYKSGDLYNSMLTAPSTFNTVNGNTFLQAVPTGGFTTAASAIYIARSSSQTGGAISANSFFGGAGGGSSFVVGGSTMPLSYPNGPDGALWVNPLWVTDGLTTNLRGRFPGCFPPMQNAPLALYDTATNIAGIAGVTGLTLLGASALVNGAVVIDITGPW